MSEVIKCSVCGRNPHEDTTPCKYCPDYPKNSIKRLDNENPFKNMTKGKLGMICIICGLLSPVVPILAGGSSIIFGLVGIKTGEKKIPCIIGIIFAIIGTAFILWIFVYFFIILP